ncbi:MAG TPA: 4-alpha-glucanotransferase, partial [Polyangia bacterium]|nr:4-alpha-glucanotransferase [Polyangia bacterium]
GPALAAAGLDSRAPFDDKVRDALLTASYSAGSMLALISFQNAFGARERINVPGTVDDGNWRYRMPTSIEALREDQGNLNRLARIADEAKRAPPSDDD